LTRWFPAGIQLADSGVFLKVNHSIRGLRVAGNAEMPCPNACSPEMTQGSRPICLTAHLHSRSKRKRLASCLPLPPSLRFPIGCSWIRESSLAVGPLGEEGKPVSDPQLKRSIARFGSSGLLLRPFVIPRSLPP
jgi:hypothetical protein